jgi:hypothetical protein
MMITILCPVAQLPPEKVATFRRSSAKLCAEKSQPVGDKIKAMLVS